MAGGRPTVQVCTRVSARQKEARVFLGDEFAAVAACLVLRQHRQASTLIQDKGEPATQFEVNAIKVEPECRLSTREDERRRLLFLLRPILRRSAFLWAAGGGPQPVQPVQPSSGGVT